MCFLVLRVKRAIICDMESWQDQGIVLAHRAHGENGAVLTLLTEHNGRHAGYVRGAQSSKKRGLLDIGNVVSVRWQARSNENLGSYEVEQSRTPLPLIWDDVLRLGALQAACALCEAALPEREGHPGLYHGLEALIAMLPEDSWGAGYVIWEIALLRELGFALDLSRCAGGGDSQDLVYISPKSGCAVSRIEGEAYKDRLLFLPSFLRPDCKQSLSDCEVLKGLRMTGYFLEHRVFAQHSRGVPEERLRFEERFAKHVDQTVNEVIQDNLEYDAG